MRFLFFIALAALCYCCTPVTKNKYADPELIKISSLKDRRETDSLVVYLIDKNPHYRAEAAMALASVQDTAASLQLGSTLLEDPYLQARINSAFALGQTGGYASVNGLIPALSDTSSAVVFEVLQALGKVVTTTDLTSLVNFPATDSLMHQGQIWGFYFAGMRGVTNKEMIARAEIYLSSTYSDNTRLGAAHFFNRASNLNKIPAEILTQTALVDNNPEVRMAALSSLRKVDFHLISEAMRKILMNEPDYRVRVNAARVVAAKADLKNEDLVLKALRDSNEHVAIAAAEALKADFSLQEDLLKLTRNSKSARVQYTLYKKMISYNTELSNEIKNLYQSASSNYQRAGLLSALSEDLSSYDFLFDEINNSSIPVIKTTAAQSLISINRNPNFTADMKVDFAKRYQSAMMSGDMGVIAIIATALADSVLNYKEVINDYSFLYEVRKKLVLPRDFEALQPLENAIAHFEGNKKSNPQNEYNHPIDWDIIKLISKDQKVVIKTTQGEIVLKLLVDEAPGSVANFVSLLNKNYFDNKFVHRVVPNFVIQTGCNRGDGFGSEDYSIRSEFSLRRYREGSVGMASAGKDTEGTQWFITHSSTPHLDGRYTIFATVESGMEVVHKIQVGDQILSARLSNN